METPDCKSPQSATLNKLKHLLSSIYSSSSSPYEDDMHVQILRLLAFAGAVAAHQWVGMENLPDGPYRGFNYPNGSTTMISLTSGKEFTFHLNETATENTRRSDSVITKRDTSCWGYQLDHSGVDIGVNQLKTWASEIGGATLTSCARNQYYGFNNNGVYVYYCINRAWSSGNLDLVDVNYALTNMDSICIPYEAGYFLWPGSPELVGKCSSGTAVCLG